MSMDKSYLSEIERIQTEIERDLQKTKEPLPAPVQVQAPREYPEPDTVPKPFPLSEPEAFYRETIKVSKPVPPRKARSWPRTVALVCLVCTLGTGSLGFGIGTAGTYAYRQWLAGINQENYGEDAYTGIPEVIGTRYAFDDAAQPGREGTIADMIKLVEPSVVSVSSVYEVSGRFSVSQGVSSGSGIIFSEDRERIFIATNHHVVEGASAVQVSIGGSEPLTARSVGSDPETDLHVISVDKRELRAAGVNRVVMAAFGDSDQMEVGDVVLAIGNAMGGGNSATRGIISAKEKTLTIEGRTLTMLQTDAAINRGNSGGPLINTRGEVIGINTAKSMATFYSRVEGMGYSISSNIAKPILDELANQKPRPALGITGLTVNEEIAGEYEIPVMGVFISGISRGSGAEKAGMQRTDIITGFNGRPVLTMEQLIEEIRQCIVGEQVEVKILRGGKDAITLQVTLGEMPSSNF
jgi:serine protease Do